MFKFTRTFRVARFCRRISTRSKNTLTKEKLGSVVSLARRGLKGTYSGPISLINRTVKKKKEERRWRKERKHFRNLRRTRVKEMRKYKDVRVLDLFGSVFNLTVLPGIGLQFLFPHFSVFSAFEKLFFAGVAILVIPFTIPYYVYTKYDINRNIRKIEHSIEQKREHLIENGQRWS